MSEEIFLEQKAFLSKLAKESGKIRCAIRTVWCTMPLTAAGSF